MAMASVERCRPQAQPQFRTGISTRAIPSCTNGDCGAEPSWRVTRSGTVDRSHWIEGWILNQLNTRGRATCQESGLDRDSGGWWMDSFRPQEFKSGSKLWSLQWANDLDLAMRAAKSYAEDALVYLKQWGIASRIQVEAEYICRNILRLHITVTGPGQSTSMIVEGQTLPDYGWVWKTV